MWRAESKQNDVYYAFWCSKQPKIEWHSRNHFIYTPNQWETTIEQAFETNACKVTVLNNGDIINFKDDSCFPEYSKVLSDKCILTCAEISKEKKVIWSNIVQLRFFKEAPDLLYFKYNYQEHSRQFNSGWKFPIPKPWNRKTNKNMKKKLEWQHPRKKILLPVVKKDTSHSNIINSLRI